MSVEILQLPNGEALYDEDTELAIRNFCISGLAAAVPKFMERDRAADLIVEWFPTDQLALASLYRRIAANQPLKAA